MAPRRPNRRIKHFRVPESAKLIATYVMGAELMIMKPQRQAKLAPPF